MLWLNCWGLRPRGIVEAGAEGLGDTVWTVLVENSIGLAAVGVAEAGIADAPVRSRRVPASIIHEAGESAGAVGDVPVNGSSTWVRRLAATLSNEVGLEPDAVGCVVTTSADADSTFDADDVDTGAGVIDCEFSGAGVAVGVIVEVATATRLVVTVPFVPVLSVTTAADTGVEPVAPLDDTDDDPSGLGPRFCVLPPPAVATRSPGATGGRWDGAGGSLRIELSLVLADEDRVGACEEGHWPVVTPVVSGSLALCAPPVLAVAPSPADEIGFLGVEPASDVGFEWLADPDEPAETCGDAELAGALPAVMALPDLADALVPVDDDEPSEPCSADATPHPVKNAVPTPSATASPPTRPIYLEAFISPPAVRKLSITDGVSDRDHMRLG